MKLKLVVLSIARLSELEKYTEEATNGWATWQSRFDEPSPFDGRHARLFYVHYYVILYMWCVRNKQERALN